MFKCGNCQAQQPKGAKASRFVIEKRDVEYKDKDGKLLGKGWEIVRELTVCRTCGAQ